jgi:hypothetical protein
MKRTNDHHTCVHCAKTDTAAGEEQKATPEPIQLPDVPRLIRVHTPDRKPFDCTVHPDGTLTAVIMGRPHRNLMSFADMIATDWSSSHIEWDPAPLEDAADGDGEAPAGTSVQDVLPVGDVA